MITEQDALQIIDTYGLELYYEGSQKLPPSWDMDFHADYIVSLPLGTNEFIISGRGLSIASALINLVEEFSNPTLVLTPNIAARISVKAMSTIRSLPSTLAMYES